MYKWPKMILKKIKNNLCTAKYHKNKLFNNFLQFKDFKLIFIHHKH